MAKTTVNAAAQADSLIPSEEIEQHILLVRGQRVILATDLARLYGVPVKQLNQQVKRNRDRFPEDFVLQLTRPEAEAILRSQIATLNDSGAAPSRSQSVTLKDPSVSKSQVAASKRGMNIKYLPYAFTEHGAIMAANLLRSDRAVKVSVFVVRAFVKLREMLSAHRELAAKLNELESKLQDHDGQIVALIDAIRSLMAEPRGRRKPAIGYHTESKRKK
ncbi:MAG TPA: ORF6N domain-containing protein [Tepidisphaeraceae bacterium]|jgi:hypothetical protein